MAIDGSSVGEFPPVKPYNSPIFPQEIRGRARRSSSRASAASPRIDSPRTMCPPDEDAFSFSPAHLTSWEVPTPILHTLTKEIQVSLVGMQHAGAAVLTGFERVEFHRQDINKNRGDADSNGDAKDDAVQKINGTAPIDMPFSSRRFVLPRLRTESTSSSQLEASMSSSVIVASSPSSMFARSPPVISLSDEAAPISPICLSPTDEPIPVSNKLLNGMKRERSFSTPMEPHNAYYATELSQLHTESIPRFRHRVRKVETFVLDARRSGTLSTDHANEFENWLADRKCLMINLEEKCRRLAVEIGLTPNGMGWSAP